MIFHTAGDADADADADAEGLRTRVKKCVIRQQPPERTGTELDPEKKEKEKKREKKSLSHAGCLKIAPVTIILAHESKAPDVVCSENMLIPPF